MSEYVKGFFSAAVMRIAIVNIVGAALFGLGIGFVPIHTTFTTISQNCSLYESPTACASVTAATCAWGTFNNNSECLFTNPIDCRSATSDDLCKALDYCLWNYDDHMCQHTAGYTAAESGVFSGAMIVGGLIGSLLIGGIVSRIGRKKSMIMLGVIATVGCALVHIATATRLYGLLVFARVVFGMSMGGLCCVAPMYVEEMVPEDYRKPVGVLFQVFCTFGIMLAALIGLLLNPTDFSQNVNMAARFQGFDAVLTIYALLVVVVGLTMEESTKWLAQSSEENIQLVATHPANEDSSNYSWGDMKFVLLVSFTLCVCQQMTGINAIMNYAPNITKSMNLKPLTGNFLVMAWNFVTTLVSIPAASRFSMRQMFLTGACIASLSCLCTGIPVLPDVTSDSTRSVLAGLGIAIFILAFEVGMGPSFYVLAQILFPESFRPKGSSFTMVTQFLFNIVINIFFPIAVEGLSGGPSGDQNKGMGIAFIFFGCCGMLSWFVLVKFLQPFEALQKTKDVQ